MLSFRLVVRLFSLAVAMMAITSLLFPQGTTLGTITGTVLDPSGAAVPGARVKVLNTGTGVARDVTSDNNGNFTAVVAHTRQLQCRGLGAKFSAAGAGEFEA